MNQFNLTTHRLNYMLAQRARSSHKNKRSQDQNTPNISQLYLAQDLTQSYQMYPQAKKKEPRPTFNQFISPEQKNKYQGDILDSLDTNRSFVDNLSHSAKKNLGNFSQRAQQSHFKESPLKTKLQFYSHQRQSRETKRKKVNWKADPPRIKRTNVYLNNLDESMHEISNNLSQITFELARNTRNLQKLQKISLQQEQSKPSKRQIIRRVNFKYAPFNEERERYLANHKRPIIEYQDKVYKDPKYIIWNPLH